MEERGKKWQNDGGENGVKGNGTCRMNKVMEEKNYASKGGEIKGMLRREEKKV